MVRKVIDGKLYDTSTADEIATYENTNDIGNFHHFSETLYKTKKGAWFIYGEGGALSKYAETGPGYSSQGEDITVLTDDEAMGWLEEYNFPELVLEYFPEAIEEAQVQ